MSPEGNISMKIGVVGTGYVGLVTGVGFAEHGHNVTCRDIDSDKVELMRKGIPPIHEEGLAEAMRETIDAGDIHFTTSLDEAAADADVVFLALPTPENADGSANLDLIFEVADQLGPIIAQKTVIVIKSTVPPKTADAVRERIAAITSVEFDVVSNPEFLQEGKALKDVKKPDRIVVGYSQKWAKKVMEKLYQQYVDNGNPIRYMSNVSAELTKYAANGFLATRVSYINEVAAVAEAVGADVKDVARAMGDDKRIGKEFNHASLGWGGSCFPKDSRALIDIAKKNGYDFKIMEAADQANDWQKQRMAQKILAFYDGHLKGKKFAVWGLAFKKDTDDVRESPALEVIDRLLSEGAEIVAHDPQAIETTKKDKRFKDRSGITYTEKRYDALEGADALVIATDWENFKGLDLPRAGKLMKAPVIFDGRLLLDPKVAKEAEFYYETIGRPVVDGRAK